MSDFATNKITADVGGLHMLIDNACVWCIMNELWSYNELSFTNHSALILTWLFYNS